MFLAKWQVCGKDAERMRKNCGIKQIVENQALYEFLSAFPHMRKKTPTKPATPPPPVGTIFAVKNPIFSIHFCISEICGIKCVKSLEIKGLRFSARLSAFFPHPFRKLALLPKTCYNKAPPKPHPLLSTTIKPLKIKRCLMLTKPLKLKHLIRLLLS